MVKIEEEIKNKFKKRLSCSTQELEIWVGVSPDLSFGELEELAENLISLAQEKDGKLLIMEALIDFLAEMPISTD